MDMDENTTTDMSFSERVLIGAFAVCVTALGIVAFYVGYGLLTLDDKGDVYGPMFTTAMGVSVIALGVCLLLPAVACIVKFLKNYIISDEHEDSSVELR